MIEWKAAASIIISAISLIGGIFYKMAVQPIAKIERRIDSVEQERLLLTAKLDALSDYIKDRNKYQEKTIDGMTEYLRDIVKRIDSLLIDNKR